MSIQPIPPTSAPTTAGQLVSRAYQNDQALAAWLGDHDGRLTDLESQSGTPGPGAVIKVGGSRPLSGWWMDTGGAVIGTPVTPAAPTFSDVAGTEDDSYTIPTTTGIRYLANGVERAAGTYPASGTVTIVAQALPGYAVVGTSTWSHTFTAGSSDTTPPTPPTLTVTAGATTLTATYGGGTDDVAVTQYRVRIDSGAWVVKSGAGSHTFTDLPDSTAYTIDAQAGDAADNWSPSTTWSGSTTAPAPFVPAGASIITTDDFTGAAGNAGGRPTDAAFGGSPVTPTETVAGTFQTSGAGVLHISGTGRLVYALAAAHPDAFMGVKLADTTTKSLSMRLRTGTSGAAAVMVTLTLISGATRARLTGGAVENGVDVAPGDEVGVSAVGTTANLYVNGTVVDTATVTVDSGANHVFVAASVAAVDIFDNLVIADMSGAV